MVLGGHGESAKGGAKSTLHHFFAAKDGAGASEKMTGSSGEGSPIKVTMGLPTLVPDDGATAVEVQMLQALARACSTCLLLPRSEGVCLQLLDLIPAVPLCRSIKKGGRLRWNTPTLPWWARMSQTAVISCSA